MLGTPSSVAVGSAGRAWWCAVLALTLDLPALVADCGAEVGDPVPESR